MKKRIRSAIVLVAALALLAVLGAVVAFAAENIDPSSDGSQYAWGENVGWLDAEPANCSDCGLEVTDTSLTGYMWGENIGWVSLGCENTSSCITQDYGVDNDGAGNLTGYAWAENVGWISFDCSNTGTCGTVDYGVTINPATGVFSGNAWGENIGWITFIDNDPVQYRVRTSWAGSLSPETEEDTVTAGGQVSTGTEPTGTDPVETTVTSPEEATITIDETSGGTVGTGFQILGQQVAITSTASYSGLNPAVIEFKLDGSLIPAGEDETTVKVFRNQLQVGEPCTGGDGETALSPDPCVSSRVMEPDGDVAFTVKTSEPSSWTFGAPSLAPPVGGIAELPDASSSSSRNYIALAALAAATLVALTAGAWYARRRWVR